MGILIYKFKNFTFKLLMEKLFMGFDENTDSFKYQYWNSDGVESNLCLKIGTITFVMGSNGSGKSSFITSFAKECFGQTKKIFSHRKICFDSNTLQIPESTLENMKQDTDARNILDFSIYRDETQTVNQQFLISALLKAENNVDRDSRITIRINKILKSSNLPIEIIIDEEKIYATKNNSSRFSIEKLSDGERSALIIIIEVLTANEKSLITIDEPERHLHHSIISNLFSQLLEVRNDCAFLIATHNLDLPLLFPKAEILLLREHKWYRDTFVDTWEIDTISAATDIDDNFKRNIIGSRNRILFVEGHEESRDKKFYSKIYPEVSIISQGNCTQVERAVKGISETQSLNWMTAFGLIDRDNRDPSQIEKLNTKNIYVLPCYSIEALYCSEVIINKIAEQQAKILGMNINDLKNKINNVIIDTIKKHKVELCARLCEKKIKTKLKLPTWKNISGPDPFKVEIDLEQELNKEITNFDSLIVTKDIQQLVNAYPIKEIGLIKNLAQLLKFKSSEDYESAVIKLLSEDDVIRNHVRVSIGGLTSAIKP